MSSSEKGGEDPKRVPDGLRAAAAVADAIDKWGIATNLRMVQEEAAELAVRVSHVCRGRLPVESLAEEAADVLLTLEVVRALVGPELVRRKFREKLERLEARLKDGVG